MQSARPIPFGMYAIGVAILLAGSSRLPAPAQPTMGPQVIKKTTLDEMLDMVKSEGYAVRKTEGDNVLLLTLEGRKAQLFIADTHESIQFHIAWADTNATLRTVNKWNRTKRFSRAYLDDEDDPHLELDLDLAGGVTRARVVDFLLTCRVSVPAFVREVVVGE